MPYRYQNRKGQTYYLHGKEVTLQNGRQQRIYYFAREPKAGEALDTLPAGREVVENPRTGLPFRKGTGAAPDRARAPAPIAVSISCIAVLPAPGRERRYPPQQRLDRGHGEPAAGRTGRHVDQVGGRERHAPLDGGPQRHHAEGPVPGVHRHLPQRQRQPIERVVRVNDPHSLARVGSALNGGSVSAAS